MPSTPFEFNPFSQIELQDAANGLTHSQNGLNKNQMTAALLAINESLGLPDISDTMKSLDNAQLRKILKKQLDKLPCDSNGLMPIAGAVRDDRFLKFVMFGMGNLYLDDHVWVANEAPYRMVFHNSCLNPLVVSAESLEEIEQKFKLVVCCVASHGPMMANIGLTKKEYFKTARDGGKAKVNTFSRFYISYAPTGRNLLCIRRINPPGGAPD